MEQTYGQVIDKKLFVWQINPVGVSTETIISRNDSILASELDGELMMMSVDNGEYYALNEIGAAVWGLLEQPKSVSEICAQLQQEFEVSEEECATDVRVFLDKATELGIITSK